MNKSILQNYISQGLSTHKIASTLNCSQTNIRHWLKKFGLKTAKSVRNKELNNQKLCTNCKTIQSIDNFYKTRQRLCSFCKSCCKLYSHKKQLHKKLKCVAYKGGKCFVCGYDRYVGALDFHHIDPTKKEFNISSLKAYSMPILKKELDKCLCVCKNCHSEIHNGIIDLKKLVDPVEIESTINNL